MSDPRRALPSMDALLAERAAEALVLRYTRPRVVAALRASLADAREALGKENGTGTPWSDPAHHLQRAEAALAAADVPSLRRVVNATGVVLHTNLGRAPLAGAALDAMAEAARGYANVEFDLDAGERGSRYDHCRALLVELTGAEDALVVNNCAAALLLCLNTVAAGSGGVVVSRGELVEIGGGFRVPEIMARSGARLIEVGSTNRTRLDDYAEAVEGGEIAALLKVHRSNFSMSGFTESVSVGQLSALGERTGLPLIHDLGSGLMDDPAALGLPSEPRPAASVAAGADLVVFSGDKLLGGPQAGLVVGRADLVARARRNPMCRALRVDKVTLAGLEATLRLYRDPPRARREIPVLRMLAAGPAELEARARGLADTLQARARTDGFTMDVSVTPGKGAVGGGTYPGVELDSWTVRLGSAAGAESLAAALRAGTVPVVARIEEDRVVMDLRTLAPEDFEVVADAVADAAARGDG